MSRLRRHALVLCTVVAVLAGAWLRADALHMGFHGDDFVQMAMLQGKFPAPRGPLDLFRFADGERDGRAVIDFGYDPWWTDPQLKLAMFRPLSSGLMALDHWLLGPDAFQQHVHSMLWWALLVGACAWLFSVMLPKPVAVLAIALFVLEEAHTVPLAWLANRNTLVATTFGLVGLGMHLRWRRTGRMPYAVAEAVAFVLALCGGEYGFSVLAYIVAYEAVVGKGEPQQRVRALAPALGAAVACLTAAYLLGFGVRGSGYYISPLESPRDFLVAAAERVPVLAGDLVWSIPATWWVDGMPWASNLASGRSWQQLLGLLAIGALIGCALFVERIVDRFQAARWLCAGSILSIVPAASALPEDRTLVAASVGASAIFAGLVVAAYESVRRALRGRWQLSSLLSLALAGYVGFAHIFHAFQRSSGQLTSLYWKIEAQRRWALRAEIPDAGARQRRVVFISGADFTTIANLPFVRSGYGHPLPHSYTRLSGAVHAHEIRRKADNVITLATLSNDVEDTMVGSLYRSKRAKFENGDAVTLAGMRVDVLRSSQGHPWLLQLTFERSLDDPCYLFVHSTKAGIRPFTMPPVGEKIRLPPPIGAQL